MLLLLSPVLYNFPSYIALYLSLSLSEIRESVFFCSGLGEQNQSSNRGMVWFGGKWRQVYDDLVGARVKERYWSYFSHV